jgi:hypothetical protein
MIDATTPTDAELLNSTIRLGDDVLRREVGDELILLDLNSEAYFGLNGSARAMIDGLTAGRSGDDVAATVATDHGAEVEAVRADLVALLRELLDAGLVDVVPR